MASEKQKNSTSCSLKQVPRLVTTSNRFALHFPHEMQPNCKHWYVSMVLCCCSCSGALLPLYLEWNNQRRNQKTVSFPLTPNLTPTPFIFSQSLPFQLCSMFYSTNFMSTNILMLQSLTYNILSFCRILTASTN